MAFHALATVVDDVRGQAVDLDVWGADVVAAADERPRLGDAGRHGTGLVEQVLDGVADRAVRGVFLGVGHGGLGGGQVHVHVVLEVFAYPRQVMDHVDAVLPQFLGRSDAREQQDFGRVDSAGTQDDLTISVGGVQLVAVEKLDADGPPVLDDDLHRLGAGPGGEVRAVFGWAQEGSGGTFAAGVALGDVVEGDPVLLGTVDVCVEGYADLLAGADERLRQRIGLYLLGDVHVAARAVVQVVESLVVLGFAEVREDIVIAPALVAE